MTTDGDTLSRPSGGSASLSQNGTINYNIKTTDVELKSTAPAFGISPFPVKAKPQPFENSIGNYNTVDIFITKATMPELHLPPITSILLPLHRYRFDDIPQQNPRHQNYRQTSFHLN